MARFLLAGGASAALMGGGLILPVVAARLEAGPPAGPAPWLVASGVAMIVCGVAAAIVGARRGGGSAMPAGVRAAVAANALFLAFFALEFSDRLVRQDGRLLYWTSFLFPPALILLCGLLAARRWAWWVCRGVAAAGVLWFLAWVAVIPFGDIRGPGGPAPWYGRVYMICVSLVFAAILAGAFRSLGRPEARDYFRLARPQAVAA